ncbi:MAG: hypothetical protein F6K42_12990 [Leptolyngbya sp. SIO1D8]|nr:hypothetical protein [Leptolyngbya sp. SIO1D8]
MHSTVEIARKLGCTTQAVNSYRRKIEKRDNKKLGKPDPNDARKTIYSPDEVALISEMAPKIPVTDPTDAEVIEAEIYEGPTTETVVGASTSLVPLRHATVPGCEIQRFDQHSANQQIAALQGLAAAHANRAGQLLGALATTEMTAAAAEIRQAVATIKTNEIADGAAAMKKAVGNGLPPQSPAS